MQIVGSCYCNGRRYFILAGKRVQCWACSPLGVKMRRIRNARFRKFEQQEYRPPVCCRCGSERIVTATLCADCCAPRTYKDIPQKERER